MKKEYENPTLETYTISIFDNICASGTFNSQYENDIEVDWENI